MSLAELVKIVHLQAIAARAATVCIAAALAETGSPELRTSLHRHCLRSAATLDQASRQSVNFCANSPTSSRFPKVCAAARRILLRVLKYRQPQPRSVIVSF
ncbi:MAG TPA: hypothetical protein VNS22_10545 [Geminicoccus sp.]|uniref:hypothetical protein n=1 Tax=Geminicoccus sp. TaxID=2024832 RepID=UPI002B7509CA|nr:hypothetical protein [Geminicoccus sp.]HWL68809.1 hypothetical protein [Geminicoccus sp.]